MKPYYESGGITIYNADCMEVLPTISPVDLVLTDPPYGLGERWNGGGGSAKSSWGFDPSEAKSWDGQVDAEALALALTKGRGAIVWGGNYYNLPPSRCWLVWDKKTPDTFTTGQAEVAWTNLDRTIRVFRFAQCEQANEGPKFHPTQKPLILMKWCLGWAQDAKTILDPFMGSGTTLVACKELGRQAIGIEREERYCEAAVKRLAQGQLFCSA